MRSGFAKLPVKRLAIGFAVLTLLVSGGAGFVAATWLRDQAIEQSRRQMANLALVLADQAANSLRAAEVVLDAIVDELQTVKMRDAATLRRRMGVEDSHRMLRERIRGVPQVAVASVLAANGDLLGFSRSQPAPTINLAGHDFFKAHLADPKLANFIGSPERGDSDGKWIFHLSRRLNNADGSMLGIVTVGIASDAWSKFYQQVAGNLGAQAALTLYRRDFTRLAGFPLPDELLGKADRTGAAFEVIEVRKRSADVIFTQGRSSAGDGSAARLTAVRQVDKYPLVVAVSLSKEQFLQGWRHSVWLIGACAAGSVVVVLAALALLMRVSYRREAQSPEVNPDAQAHVPVVESTGGAPARPPALEPVALARQSALSQSATNEAGAAITAAPPGLASSRSTLTPQGRGVPALAGSEFDYGQALAESNPELLRMIAGSASEQYPLDMAAIRAALGAGDGLAAARAAHSMNGTLGLFKARPAVASVRLIEKMARAGQFDEATRELAILEAQIAALQKALAQRVA